jgi:hypothetical protein
VGADGDLLHEAAMNETFFDLPNGKVICFNPGGRWHGWIFHRHIDGRLVSEYRAAEVKPPLDDVLWGAK